MHKMRLISLGVVILAVGMVTSAMAQSSEEEEAQSRAQEELAHRTAALERVTDLADHIRDITEDIPILTQETEEVPRGYKIAGERVVGIFDALNLYTANIATRPDYTALVPKVGIAYLAAKTVAELLMQAAPKNAFVIADRNVNNGVLNQDGLAAIASLNQQIIFAVEDLLLKLVPLQEPSLFLR